MRKCMVKYVLKLFGQFSFFVKYGIPEVREVSRNLPGARGFVVIEYEPVASHGNPFQARNYRFSDVPNSVLMLSGLRKRLYGPNKSVGSLEMDYVDTIIRWDARYMFHGHKYEVI